MCQTFAHQVVRSDTIFMGRSSWRTPTPCRRSVSLCAHEKVLSSEVVVKASQSLPRLRSTCLPENWGHSSIHHSINNTFTSVHPDQFGFLFFHLSHFLFQTPSHHELELVLHPFLPGSNCHLGLFIALDLCRVLACFARLPSLAHSDD